MCVFPFFFSYLVLSAFIVAHLFCTRTSSSNPYPKSNFGFTEPGSEPGSRAEIPLRRDNRRYVAFFWYASPRQKIFKPPFDSIRVHVLCIVYVIYLHREEIPRYTKYSVKPVRLKCSQCPSLESNLIRHHKGKCIRRRHMRACVDHPVTCAVPTRHHINTDKSHAFHLHALILRLGWSKFIFGISYVSPSPEKAYWTFMYNPDAFSCRDIYPQIH